MPFLESNEVSRPITIRTNTLKTKRRDLAQVRSSVDLTCISAIPMTNEIISKNNVKQKAFVFFGQIWNLIRKQWSGPQPSILSCICFKNKTITLKVSGSSTHEIPRVSDALPSSQCKSEVATDPECRSRLRQESAFFLRIWNRKSEKPEPDPESLSVSAVAGVCAVLTGVGFANLKNNRIRIKILKQKPSRSLKKWLRTSLAQMCSKTWL